jgi:hypothetical protein
MMKQSVVDRHQGFGGKHKTEMAQILAKKVISELPESRLTIEASLVPRQLQQFVVCVDSIAKKKIYYADNKLPDILLLLQFYMELDTVKTTKWKLT